MNKKPRMKWATATAAKLSADCPGADGVWAADMIEVGAEPIMAVVRAVISEEGQCCLCCAFVTGNHVEGNNYGDIHDDLDNGKPCPVPAAFKAMEETS